MCRIRQHFDNTSVKDIQKRCRKNCIDELRLLESNSMPGRSVAIAAGSRGIAIAEF